MTQLKILLDNGNTEVLEFTTPRKCEVSIKYRKSIFTFKESATVLLAPTDKDDIWAFQMNLENGQTRSGFARYETERGWNEDFGRLYPRSTKLSKTERMLLHEAAADIRREFVRTRKELNEKYAKEAISKFFPGRPPATGPYR